MEPAREKDNDQKKQKKTFFEALYALDKGDDREEEEEEIVRLLKESKQRNQPKASTTRHDRTVNSRGRREIRSVEGALLRTSTAPDRTPSSVDVEWLGSRCADTDTRVDLPWGLDIKGTGCEESEQQPRPTSVTTPTISTPTPAHLHPRRSSKNKPVPSMPGKRKRVQSVQLRPESQQIFKGLSFYFLPNDEIAPARRIRIRTAMEHGAVWVKEWREGISYIIADRRLCLNDVLKYFKWTSIPAGTILVNEMFPIECIQFGCVLDPKRVRFLVDGDEPESKEKEPPIEQSAISDVSLQIKPVSRSSRVLETPSRSEENPVVERVPQTVLPEPKMFELVKKVKGITYGKSSDERPKDVLEEAIIEAEKLKHLPLDSENEDETSQDDGEDSNNSEDESGPRRKRPRTRGINQSTFLCMQSHNNDNPKSDNPNARTIEILQEMADYYDRINDTWRPIAYRKAISVLRKQAQRISTFAEASALPHIGERLALKVEEIVSTDRLRRLESTKTDDCHDQTLQTFLAIYGVGFAQANRWVSQGHRTLDDLLRRGVPLTKNQRIGIDRHTDFNTRIPRSEVEALGAVVKNAACKLDPDLQIVIMGSYRRGATTSSDIDLIVTKPRTSSDTLRTIVLERLIPTLFEQGFLKVALASTSPRTGSKWHGACSLPVPQKKENINPNKPNNNEHKHKADGKEKQRGNQEEEDEGVWRRIDFLLVPEEELGAAMIYFTGNDIFNRSLRLLARKKGMRLNQRGLWRDGFPRLAKATNGRKNTGGELVEGRSERRIFEILEVPWREAVERNA
ncbi:MAG: hypothetical protein M1816_000797 [Peltula sp. TS41687]|nr:MAG: hypothetical protein M1816_000797 [Peltula sp. TS41687]